MACQHLTNILPTLDQYPSYTLLATFRHLIPMAWQHLPNIPPTTYQYASYTLLTPLRHLTDGLPTPYQYPSHNLPIRFLHLTNTLSTPYRWPANTLPIFFRHLTDNLPPLLLKRIGSCLGTVLRSVVAIFGQTAVGFLGFNFPSSLDAKLSLKINP